jgi:long-chain acyl-CoA synthetase
MLARPRAYRLNDILEFWAQRAPEAAALWEEGRAITYGTLAAERDAAIALLKARTVRRGDRVMIVGENCAAQVAFFFAASALAAWPVLVNARLTERELESIGGHCEARVRVFVGPEEGAAAVHARRAQVTLELHPLLGPVALWLTSGGIAAEPPELAERVAALIYTSGTTGAPKGVMVTHEGLLGFAARSSAVRGLTAADIAFGALPLSHIFGVATILLTTLYAGASVWLVPRFDAAAACETLSARRISVLHGVPSLYARLLAHLGALPERPRFAALRYLYAGGGALDAELKRRVEKMFGIPLHHGYGMTEYAGSMFITHVDRPRLDPLPGELAADCEVSFRDASGVEVGAGTAGEIWIRGPGTMLGYYRAPELTREVLTKEGWLRTGDVGFLEPDGALRIVGRSRDVIKRSGFTVYPLEVEAELANHPAVHQAAVLGMPESAAEERIIAFIELRPGAAATNAELLHHARQRLAGYKVPQQIVIVDRLPLTENGKVRKLELRRQWTDTAACV